MTSLWQVKLELKGQTLSINGVIHPASRPHLRNWYSQRLHHRKIVESLLFSERAVASASFQQSDLRPVIGQQRSVSVSSKFGAWLDIYRALSIAFQGSAFEVFLFGSECICFRACAVNELEIIFRYSWASVALSLRFYTHILVVESRQGAFMLDSQRCSKSLARRQYCCQRTMSW